MYIDRAIILDFAINYGYEQALKVLLMNHDSFAGGEESFDDLVAMLTDPDYLNKPETWFEG